LEQAQEDTELVGYADQGCVGQVKAGDERKSRQCVCMEGAFSVGTVRDCIFEMIEGDSGEKGPFVLKIML